MAFMRKKDIKAKELEYQLTNLRKRLTKLDNDHLLLHDKFVAERLQELINHVIATDEQILQYIIDNLEYDDDVAF